MQVEALTNEEEVELRSKIEALGLEVTKLPSKSTHHLDEVVLNIHSLFQVFLISPLSFTISETIQPCILYMK